MINESRLIQRLKKPTDVFVDRFGAGLKNGGLSDEEVDKLVDIFSFDYMGAAQFEHGKVPEAIRKITQASEENDLLFYSLAVSGNACLNLPTSEIDRDQQRKIEASNILKAHVYVITPSAFKDHVDLLLPDIATDIHSCLERSMFCESVFNPDQSDDAARYQSIAWLEISNGFFFTADFNTYKKFAKLFEKDVGDEEEMPLPDFSQVNKEISTFLKKAS